MINIKSKLIVAFIICSIPFWIMFLISAILCIIDPLDEITIQQYINICHHNISLEMTTKKNEQQFGVLMIHFVNQDIPMKTVFYDTFMINEIYIKSFLNSLDWSHIIKTNGYNDINIPSMVLQQYLSHLSKIEIIYNQSLLNHTNISIANNDISCILYDFINQHNVYQDYEMYVPIFVENLDIMNYMKTNDYQRNQCQVLTVAFVEYLDTISFSLQEEVQQYNKTIVENKLIIKRYMDNISNAINLICFYEFFKYYKKLWFIVYDPRNMHTILYVRKIIQWIWNI